METIKLTSPNEKHQLTQTNSGLQLTTVYTHEIGLKKWFLSPSQITQTINYQHILNCQLTSTTNPKPSVQMKLTFMKINHRQKHTLKTLTLTGHYESDPPFSSDNSTASEEIQTWIHELMAKSYPQFEGIPSTRSILIIINPASGSKNGLKIWSSIVEPMLKSSTAKYEAIFTTHAGHAAEIGENIDLNKYHVVSCISGDGLIHEFLNGLGSRKSDFERAINQLVLTSIPAGSGNALSTNHIGPKQAINIHLATLNLLKGRPTRIDLCSMTQLHPETKDTEGGPETTNKTEPIIRRFSFLSVSFGLMADVDVGTEALRWMGPTRFILGYIWGAIRNRSHRIRLDLQLIQSHKQEIANTFYDLRDKNKNKFVGSSNQISTKLNHDSLSFQDQDHENDDTDFVKSPPFETSTGLLKLKYGDVGTDLKSTSLTINQNKNDDSRIIKHTNDDQWITIETDVISLYAGILPFMSNDLLQFPAKIPGMDSSIDLALHRPTSIWGSLSLLIGAESGQIFRNHTVEYFKVKAFRLTPLSGTKKATTTPTTTTTETSAKSRQSPNGRSANTIPKDASRPSTEDTKSKKDDDKNKKPKLGKNQCHIALDGESLPFCPLQMEIHDRLLRTLSLVQPHDAPYFGSIGVPDRIL